MKEGFRQAMAWLHTWTGLIFGWLLFAIFLTGTLSYFKDEMTHWMQPLPPVHSVNAEQSVALAQGYLQAHAQGAARWFIGLPHERQPGLSVAWQRPAKNEGERGEFFDKVLDPLTGAERVSHDTAGGNFFYRFHFQLQMNLARANGVTVVSGSQFLAQRTGSTRGVRIALMTPTREELAFALTKLASLLAAPEPRLFY